VKEVPNLLFLVFLADAVWGFDEEVMRISDVGDSHSGRLFVMTSLKETLKSDLTVAMKASDDLTKSTLRMALSAITNAEVAGDEAVDLSDDQIVKVLQAESKKRLESAEIYEQNGRAEAAAKEKAEAEVLAKYLPAAMSDSELAAVVAQEVAAAAAAGNSGMKAMGLVVKAVREKVGSSADGSKIADLVKSALAQ
jgi:uncharacterized protein YqeY